MASKDTGVPVRSRRRLSFWAATIALLMLLAIPFAGCSNSQMGDEAARSTDSLQANVDTALDYLSYAVKSDQADRASSGVAALFDEDGGLLTSFDPSKSSVSAYIPSYDVSVSGELSPSALVHVPLFADDRLVGFIIYFRNAVPGSEGMLGISEEGAAQVADFAERNGSISLVNAQDGIWMVANGATEKLTVDLEKWFGPIGREDNWADYGPYDRDGKSQLGPMLHADLLGLESADLGYRHEGNLVLGERAFGNMHLG